MRARGSIRFIAPLMSAVMAAGALTAAPAHAGKACKSFKPVVPESPSAEAAEALDANVVKIGDMTSKHNPVAIEFTQGSGFWLYPDTPIEENSEFFNFQVLSEAAVVELNLHVMWAAPTKSDIDEHLFSSKGEEIASSVSFNPAPELNPSTGGEAFEHIAIKARRCGGFTLESRPFNTRGEDVTIHAWLRKLPS